MCAGIENLCKALGFDVSDRRVLIMAWKMQAKQMGTFTQEEFERGKTQRFAKSSQNLLRLASSCLDPLKIGFNKIQLLYWAGDTYLMLIVCCFVLWHVDLYCVCWQDEPKCASQLITVFWVDRCDVLLVCRPDSIGGGYHPKTEKGPYKPRWKPGGRSRAF